MTLTRRQRQVVIGLAQSKKNAAIATDLGIHEKTVEYHRGCLKRFGLFCVADIVKYAVRNGLIEA